MKRDEYGEHYQYHLLEQYKLYVQMADNISLRRGQANAFYISIISALMLAATASSDHVPCGFRGIILIAVAALCIPLCVLWLATIRSYRRLNSCKFRVINAMEAELPYECYKTEWALVRADEIGKSSYLNLTSVESCVPAVLGFAYLMLLSYLVLHIR